MQSHKTSLIFNDSRFPAIKTTTEYRSETRKTFCKMNELFTEKLKSSSFLLNTSRETDYED